MIPKVSNKMENKFEEQFILIQTTIEHNKQEMKFEIKAITETLKVFTTSMMYQTNVPKYSPSHKDTLTPLDPTKVVPTNRVATPLEGDHSTKMGCMWTLKHDIISPKFYEILLKTELKGDTALDIKNFFNHIKMCLNAVTRLRENLLTYYQSIKRHSEFE